MSDMITRGPDGLRTPDRPVIPFIEGDGIGGDVWRATRRVIDAAVEKAYSGRRAIQWLEVFAGEKSFNQSGNWLPDKTIEAFRHFLVGLKGPLTTPVGGGIRSLNLALRQALDLYVCLRPVRYFQGAPSPMKHPEKVDMVVFRENTEDIYSGIEWLAESPEARQLLQFLRDQKLLSKVRFPETSGFSLKPVSREGSERLIRAAIVYALKYKRRGVTLVHKGNIMKFTEGAFRDWGYALAAREFRMETVSWRESRILESREQQPDISVENAARAVEPGYNLMTPDRQKKVRDEIETAWKLWPTHGDGKWRGKLPIQDIITDIALEKVITLPENFDVLATTNLNGDYISDALAGQIGGIGIAPGANVNYETGHAVFEATHGSAPPRANLDIANPTSLILSGDLLLRHIEWREAADLIIRGLEKTLAAKFVTYDFHRLLPDATKVKCSEFADHLIRNMSAD
jgi:isocitrate dehydrogenase